MNVIDQAQGAGFTAYHGDCIDVVSGLPSDSVHYSIFSPPFASLYVFSDSDRDMSNVKSHDEFFTHFKFLIAELHRVLKPGRLVSIHCCNLPKSMAHDGVIGLYDFRGDVIRAFESCGFVYHSEVCIWKDPVVAMQRTKALGLLHKQVKKDSAMSRQGIPDYLVTMRKPGANPEPVSGMFDAFNGGDVSAEEFSAKSHIEWQQHGKTGDFESRHSIDIWQRYASPVWLDIKQGDVLNFRDAKTVGDEKHITPLQLGVIERGLDMWSNPGDVVLSPFMGIGSEGYVSIKKGRRFVGVELKESYYRQAVANLHGAEVENQQMLLAV